MKNTFYRSLTAIIFMFLLITRAGAATIGNVHDWRESGNMVVLQCDGGDIALSFMTGNILRVEALAEPIERRLQPLLSLERGPGLTGVRLDRKGKKLISGEMTVEVSEAPFSFKLLKGDKTLLRLVPDGIQWKDDGSYKITFSREKGDGFFGLGEMQPDPLGITMRLDNRRNKRAIWNRHIPPSDIGIPLFYNPLGYGLFVENPWKSEFDFTIGGTFSYSADGGPITFYVIDAPDIFKMLDRYTGLTGKPPIPPRWAAGYMQSKFGYQNEKDYRWLMSNFRDRNIPCDALIFDLDWFGGMMGNLMWNKTNFPDAEGFQEELEKNGFKSITIVEPYVFKESSNFNEGIKNKIFTKNKSGDQFVFPFWGTKAGLMDFTNPETRKWFGGKVKAIHLTGVDAWWTDLNEPEWDSDEMIYYLGKREAAHNLEAFLMNKAIRDMYDEEFPNERCFMMSRSGFAGIQRFGSSVWSGDVAASWAHLKAQIPIAISTSISGIPLWNSDTGGFHNLPSPELYTRWIQFSAFTPIFRSHGDHTVREPWSFGAEAEQICKKYIELRMKLVPYLYTLFYEMSRTGAPVIRPTFAEFPEEAHELVGQYFYGKQLLIAPVTEGGATKKNVSLPAGNWTYFWDDRVMEGPKKVSVPVDLETMPIFVREGAIIPMAPVMQYTREKPVDPLTIHYYPGRGLSSYDLYEDDGESRAYENGESAITHIEAERKDRRISIRVADPRGGYKGMPEKRSYEIVIHHSASEGKVLAQGLDPRPAAKYDAEKQTLSVTTPPVGKGFSVDINF
jgi:alpha-glucosidase